MKKKITTGMIIAGSVILSAGLAGCGAQNTKQADITKDSLIQKAADTFASLKSVDADIDMDMDVKISATGFSMEMKNDAQMEAESCNDGSSHIKGHMNMSAIGMEKDADVEMYTVKEGDEFIQYYKITESGNEDVWTYSKSDNQALASVEELDESKVNEAVQKLNGVFSDMKLHKDTVNFNNVNCYLMEGTVEGEKIAQFMTETVPDIDQTALDSYKMMDFDTSFYFKANDETPYAVVIDMKDAVKNIVAAQLDQTEGLNMDISAEEMKATVIFNSFNNVKEIKVPEEVKKKAVETSEPFDMTSLTGMFGQNGSM